MTVLRSGNLSDVRLQEARRPNIIEQVVPAAIDNSCRFRLFVFDMDSHLLTISVSDRNPSSRVSYPIRSSLHGFVSEKNVTASGRGARVRQRNERPHHRSRRVADSNSSGVTGLVLSIGACTMNSRDLLSTSFALTMIRNMQ